MNKVSTLLLLPAFALAPLLSRLPGVAAPDDFNCKVYVPNAFTPNNDGTNDVFKPETNCEILTYELRIFNRWGDLVFFSQSPGEGWNGEIKSRPAAAGTYIYLLKYATGNGEVTKNEVLTGDLALLR